MLRQEDSVSWLNVTHTFLLLDFSELYNAKVHFVNMEGEVRWLCHVAFPYLFDCRPLFS